MMDKRAFILANVVAQFLVKKKKDQKSDISVTCLTEGFCWKLVETNIYNPKQKYLCSHLPSDLCHDHVHH